MAEPTISSQAVEVQPQVERVKSESRKFPVILPLFLLLLVGIFYLARFVVPQALFYLTKAANSPGKYSLANSYVFGSPLLANANGQDKIRITAFLLDDKGRGVPNQSIEITVRAKEGVVPVLPAIVTVQPDTDEFGRAVFEITSSVPGQFVVVASVGGLEFPQTVTLTFK